MGVRAFDPVARPFCNSTPSAAIVGASNTLRTGNSTSNVRRIRAVICSSQQRMPTQLEKVLLDSHLFNLQQLLPDVRQLRFCLIPRINQLGFFPQTQWLTRQAAPRDLPCQWATSGNFSIRQ